MPIGVYKHKAQQGFQKGHSCYLIKHTEETKKKLSMINKGKKPSLLAIQNSIKVRKNNPDFSQKCRDSKLKNPTKYWLGKKRPEMMGNNNPMWTENPKTDESKLWRNRIEYRLWREAVFARDNWTCQKYGIRGGKLHPHHIQNFAQYPELRFAIDNGITLSDKAHREFHSIYGNRNNTKEQLEEFLKVITINKLSKYEK